MTREEIEEFSGVELNCFETDREEDWYKIGCIDGLKAADAEPNLASLWHDASEEPKGDNWEIICQNEKGECYLECKADSMRLPVTWGEYAAIKRIIKWAYISDLLPKQSGNSEQLKGGEK